MTALRLAGFSTDELKAEVKRRWVEERRKFRPEPLPPRIRSVNAYGERLFYQSCELQGDRYFCCIGSSIHATHVSVDELDWAELFLDHICPGCGRESFATRVCVPGDGELSCGVEWKHDGSTKQVTRRRGEEK